MAIVLALSRSPSVPRLGLSGSGRAPGCAAYAAKTDCREKAAATKTAANTQIPWNGRFGHRKPPFFIANPRRQTAAYAHTLALQPATFVRSPLPRLRAGRV